MTKRKPAIIGDLLAKKFMAPFNMAQGELAQATRVSRKQPQATAITAAESTRQTPATRATARNSDLLFHPNGRMTRRANRRALGR